MWTHTNHIKGIKRNLFSESHWRERERQWIKHADKDFFFFKQEKSGNVTSATFALYSPLLKWEEWDNLITIWFVAWEVKGSAFLFPQASLTLRFFLENLGWWNRMLKQLLKCNCIWNLVKNGEIFVCIYEMGEKTVSKVGKVGCNFSMSSEIKNMDKNAELWKYVVIWIFFFSGK